MLVANDSGPVEFHHAPEHLGSDVRTARLIAQIFREKLFVSVRSPEACFDRYLRNGRSPNEPNMSDAKKRFVQVVFVLGRGALDTWKGRTAQVIGIPQKSVRIASCVSITSEP